MGKGRCPTRTKYIDAIVAAVHLQPHDHDEDVIHDHLLTTVACGIRWHARGLYV